MAPETCPICGADVPPRAKACPQCGADAETGWSEAAKASGLGLPDEEFDYEGFVEQEFATPKAKPRGLNWFWWLVAIVVLLAIVIAFIHR